MPLPIIAAYGLRAGGAMLLKKVIKSKLGKEVKEKLKNAIIKKFTKRKIRKRLKELKKRKVERQTARHEKNLKREVSRTPTITRFEARAKDKERKEYIKKGTEEIKRAHREVLAKFHKDFPDHIGGMGNTYGHGKGLGAKFDRLIGTSKKGIQKVRQYKRENKQVAKQRRQRGEPERRAVRRPKSGLYKDTPKKGT